MAPFAEKKFAPVISHNDMGRIRRVLDVGCGPGTNAHHFQNSEYLGIDLNEQYIESAKRRYGNHFIAADAAEFVAKPSERFDFILINSFLHHLDTPTTQRILANLARLLTEDGHINILELVSPDSASVASFLARSDRGKFARKKPEWAQIFQEAFQQEVFEPYDLDAFGITLWEMLYFKGRVRQAA
jgi:ubiquinone/menaquinone biosynthesis C-methylase UbiE